MYRKRHKRGKRLASVFLTVALITATVPVQAAEFGTPDSFEEIFSSGEEDSCITDTENTLPAASDSEKVMASELSPTPTVTSTPEGTPALTETPTPSVTPMPSSTPTPSVTPSPSPNAAMPNYRQDICPIATANICRKRSRKTTKHRACVFPALFYTWNILEDLWKSCCSFGIPIFYKIGVSCSRSFIDKESISLYNF